MRRRGLLAAGALVLAGVTGAIATIALDGAGRPGAVPRTARLSTATIERTSLMDTVLTEGTLGYAPTEPVVNALSGTYTLLPQPGSTIEPGGTLYDVDNAPVVLFTGPVPAWRSFAPGMSNGPDVAELESNLLALGDASGLYSAASDRFTYLTAAAIERWQVAAGLPVDGRIPFGQVVFLPGAVVVGAESVSAGQPASPGDLPFAVSSTARTVIVPLNPDLPPVHGGEAVTIHLPTGTKATGTIATVGPAPPAGPSAHGGGATTGGGSVATVTPDDTEATGSANGVAVQVSLVTASARDVLAAPISALLALAEGGYGVEVVEPSGSHHLVGVTTGLFTGTKVQVAGRGIQPGTKVVVAQ